MTKSSWTRPRPAITEAGLFSAALPGIERATGRNQIKIETELDRT